jgi:hypothetical protein
MYSVWVGGHRGGHLTQLDVGLAGCCFVSLIIEMKEERSGRHGNGSHFKASDRWDSNSQYFP